MKNRIKFILVSRSEANYVIEKWLDLWGSYDLDKLGDIFWNDPGSTYFSSEKVGIIKGFEALIPHHTEFGFEAGGKIPDQSLWLEDLDYVLHDDIAVVNALWFFGDLEKDFNAYGPVTFVLIKTTDQGVRIAHTHFANYE